MENGLKYLLKRQSIFILDNGNPYKMNDGPNEQNAFVLEKLNRETLHQRCPYSEFIWSVIPRIRTEYLDLLCKHPSSARMREMRRLALYMK